MSKQLPNAIQVVVDVSKQFRESLQMAVEFIFVSQDKALLTEFCTQALGLLPKLAMIGILRAKFVVSTRGTRRAT